MGTPPDLKGKHPFTPYRGFTLGTLFLPTRPLLGGGMPPMIFAVINSSKIKDTQRIALYFEDRCTLWFKN